MFLLDFHCKENDRSIWFLGHVSYTQNSSTVIMVFMKVGSLFVESRVYGYYLETKLFRHFLCNENPIRALNSTLLKCCLPSTDAIDR